MATVNKRSRAEEAPGPTVAEMALLSFEHLSPPLQNAQLSRPGSPIVLLHDLSSARGKPLGWGRKPETIRLITRDLIRDLVKPALSCQEANCQVIPEQADVALHHIPPCSIINHCSVAVNERKKSMKLKEILRKKNAKLNDLEEEAKERAQYLLERANHLRMEQEDEIKKLGEKKQIDKELTEEEMRLARLMEVERQKANQMQDDLARKRKEELYR
ncbi:hypothetical protein Chor_014773 [Crotalus horridus]